MIGNRYPTTADEAARQAQQQGAAQGGGTGVSILMDLIRRLMEDGDYEGLAKVLPQMYPPEELGAPPGPVLPEPEADPYGVGEGFPSGMLDPGYMPEPVPEGGGNYPDYPLTPGPNVGEYSNPFVSELPGMLGGSTPSFPTTPNEAMRMPGPQPELPPDVLGSLGVPPATGMPPTPELLDAMMANMQTEGLELGGPSAQQINEYNPVNMIQDMLSGQSPVPAPLGGELADPNNAALQSLLLQLLRTPGAVPVP